MVFLRDRLPASIRCPCVSAGLCRVGGRQRGLRVFTTSVTARHRKSVVCGLGFRGVASWATRGAHFEQPAIVRDRGLSPHYRSDTRKESPSSATANLLGNDCIDGHRHRASNLRTARGTSRRRTIHPGRSVLHDLLCLTQRNPVDRAFSAVRCLPSNGEFLQRTGAVTFTPPGPRAAVRGRDLTRSSIIHASWFIWPRSSGR